ncbi:calmodulin binding domain protein [Teladorsagia circumcincta]|uniref:Calmodulin binding domain protein n=1 Tax=Teladorsagia circumcincta TaxID=45464 RepID=A0A2G9UV01_TELCI|nr:calmodulin binding domain protein [Teladorsagia circumcincta]
METVKDHCRHNFCDDNFPLKDFLMDTCPWLANDSLACCVRSRICATYECRADENYDAIFLPVDGNRTKVRMKHLDEALRCDCCVLNPRLLHGATIASAPSVEQEDYRTPKPSFDKNGGKSFDCCGPTGSLASDSNGLVKVSADFLRLNGSRQQFRNLLSTRKKLGSLPPAYTRIDYSRESLDSNPNRTAHHGPVITVEDTGSQLRINRVKSSITDSLVDSHKASLENTTVAFCESNGSAGSHPTTNHFKRHNSRVKITDRALVLAMLGIVVMVIDAEITGQNLFGITKAHPVSLMLRSFVALSTVALLTQIVLYHINDIVLDLVDCGADDWRVVVTTDRALQFCTEFLLCAICPLPGTGTLHWSFIETARNMQASHGRSFYMKEVPLDVPLSILMLSRVYLFARFMVLHSKQFQDASTRTLAALNRIQVNFSFVLKTVLDQQPILFLTAFTIVFWIVTSWTFVQCERFGQADQDVPSILYSNALWFIAITFMLNGYGDIVPQTHAGRIIAIFVGVIGAIISSILIAVISRNILLSQGQRNVNNFMHDSKLTREHKNAAAKSQLIGEDENVNFNMTGSPNNRIGHVPYQPLTILAEDLCRRFRAIKNEMRVFAENNSANSQQVTRLVAEMHFSMQRLVSAQEEMRAQIEVLQRAVRNHYANTQQRTVIRPVTMYGAERWSASKEIERRLGMMETKMLRWTAGITRSDRIRSDTVRDRSSVAPVADKMRESRFSWYGHVLGEGDSVRKIGQHRRTRKAAQGTRKAALSDTLLVGMELAGIHLDQAFNREK